MGSVKMTARQRRRLDQLEREASDTYAYLRSFTQKLVMAGLPVARIEELLRKAAIDVPRRQVRKWATEARRLPVSPGESVSHGEQIAPSEPPVRPTVGSRRHIGLETTRL
jgi:hypothetical protein